MIFIDTSYYIYYLLNTRGVRMNKSEHINDLAKALSAAQAEITGAMKDSMNPHFKSTYADLAAIWDAVRGPLTKNKLAVTQCLEVQHEDRTLQLASVDILATTLMHESGQWIESVYPIRPIKNDPQGFAAAVTYARRYSLAAITGCPSIDDDGNTASGIGINTPPQSNPQSFKKIIRSKEEVSAIHEAIKAQLVGWEITDRPAFQYDVSHYIETNSQPQNATYINAFIATNRNVKKIVGDKKS